MGQLKTILLILCLVNCYYEALGGSKYTDENRPYEFGFTIDGEQHRHEKKDENGIIMGEFGFITADGVYHVTVYATDENGNFKILSMKNIRVKPYPSASNAGTRQGHSLTLPSSNVTPKTSLNTANKAPSYKQELKAGPAKSCSSCSVPTTTTQPPQVFISGNAPSHNQPVENEYDAQIPPNSNNFYTEQRPVQANNNQKSFSDNRNQQINGQNYDTQTPNRQLYSQNESSRKPSIELDTPLLNDYPKNSGINDNNYQQRLIPNKENQALYNNNNYQQNHRESSDVLGGDQEKIGGNSNFPSHNYPQEVNDYGQPISSAEPIKSQNTFENYPNNIYDKRKLFSAGQNYPSTSNDGQKDGNIKSVGINTYPNNKELSNGEIIAPKNTFKENRQPKSFRDILESVNPEQNFNAVGSNSGQNKELSGKPVLVAAQMQIVDKNTDIYHKNPGEIDGLPKGLNNNDIKQLLYTFNYTVGFHGHHEEGYTNGAKYGYYYVTGRNGVRTRVDYVADETGFHPKISQEMLDILSDDVPKPETERDEKYGLKGYEFKWLYYPVE